MQVQRIVTGPIIMLIAFIFSFVPRFFKFLMEIVLLGIFRIFPAQRGGLSGNSYLPAEPVLLMP